MAYMLVRAHISGVRLLINVYLPPYFCCMTVICTLSLVGGAVREGYEWVRMWSLTRGNTSLGVGSPLPVHSLSASCMEVRSWGMDSQLPAQFPSAMPSPPLWIDNSLQPHTEVNSFLYKLLLAMKLYTSNRKVSNTKCPSPFICLNLFFFL